MAQVEDMDTDSREEQIAGMDMDINSSPREEQTPGMDMDINSSPVEVGASSAPSHQDEAALRRQRQERLWDDLRRYGPLLEPRVQDDLEAYCRRQLETLSQSVPKVCLFMIVVYEHGLMRALQGFGLASASQSDLD